MDEKLIVENEIIPSMDEFKNEIYKGLKKIYVDDIMEGKIIAITDTELLINLGYISDGIIPIEETMVNDEMSLKDLYKEGDIIKAKIIKKDDGDGNVLLSIKKAEEILVWDELEEAYKNEKNIVVKVNEIVKGGAVCNVKGVRAFIPASLISTKYVEDLKDYLGRVLTVKIIEFNKEDKKIILSRKVVESLENETKRSELFKSIKIGNKYMGTVVKLMNFGAFVDMGGVQGLVHINDLSWKRIKHPSEIVKEGDKVEVYVLDIDTKTKKIALGLKDINEDPWINLTKNYSIGKVVLGEVVRITNFGAFVKIGDGIEGLVHISEMSDKRISKPEDIVSVGDNVQVKIMGIDTSARRIQLSMKSAEESLTKESIDKFQSKEEATTSLEDVFKVFLKDIKD